MPKTPATIENRSAELLEIHRKLSTKFEIVLPPSSEQSTEVLLAQEILKGRTEGTSRHDLAIGTIGVLINAGWSKERIEECLTLIESAFLEADPNYRFEANTRALEESLSRHAKKEPIPGFPHLSKTVAQSSIDKIKKLLATGSTRLEKVVRSILKAQFCNRSVPDPEYLFEPFIWKDCITAFTGAPSSGKSTILLDIMQRLANEREDVLVIYCDRDNPPSIAKERNARLLQTDRKDLISYWCGELDIEDGETQAPFAIEDSQWPDFVRMVKETGKHPVICFDTFNSFLESGQSENDNVVVGNLMNHFRKLTYLGCSVCVVHHTGKSDSSNVARGASAFLGGVDALWLVTATMQNTALDAIRVESKKERLGETEKFTFRMKDGRPVSEAQQQDTYIFDFICRNANQTKEKIEIAASKGQNNISRANIRETITKYVLSKHLRIDENKRICVVRSEV